MTGKSTIILTDDELREIFALFSSPTDYERQQVYDKTETHFYEREDLSREYTLTQERREFAEDAWRAISYSISCFRRALDSRGTVKSSIWRRPLAIQSSLKGKGWTALSSNGPR
jgi:hypothetical protein